MGQKDLYITSLDYFDGSALKNPISCLDHTLEAHFPQFYEANYDLRIVATKTPTEEERTNSFYNDYRERYGHSHLSAIDEAIAHSGGKHVFLNGFNQKQFDYIAPLIKDTTVLLYLFKCRNIKDLSFLSQFPKLECVMIYGNCALESLWNMEGNPSLQVLSFVHVTKLRHIEGLAHSKLEYVCFDSGDLYGNKKEMLFDKSVLDKVATLKHLSLMYKKPK